MTATKKKEGDSYWYAGFVIGIIIMVSPLLALACYTLVLQSQLQECREQDCLQQYDYCVKDDLAFYRLPMSLKPGEAVDFYIGYEFPPKPCAAPAEEDVERCIEVPLANEDCNKVDCYKDGVLVSEETWCKGHITIAEPSQAEEDDCFEHCSETYYDTENDINLCIETYMNCPASQAEEEDANVLLKPVKKKRHGGGGGGGGSSPSTPPPEPEPPPIVCDGLKPCCVGDSTAFLPAGEVCLPSDINRTVCRNNECGGDIIYQERDRVCDGFSDDCNNGIWRSVEVLDVCLPSQQCEVDLNTQMSFCADANACSLDENVLENFNDLSGWSVAKDVGGYVIQSGDSIKGNALQLITEGNGNGEWYMKRRFDANGFGLWFKSEAVDHSTSPHFQILSNTNVIAGIEFNFGTFTYCDGRKWLPVEGLAPEPNKWYYFELLRQSDLNYGLRIYDADKNLLVSKDWLGLYEGSWANTYVMIGIYDRHNFVVNSWFDELVEREALE